MSLNRNMPIATRLDWLRLLGFYALTCAAAAPWLFVLRTLLTFKGL